MQPEKDARDKLNEDESKKNEKGKEKEIIDDDRRISPIQKYDTTEHVEIGNRAFKAFLKDKKNHDLRLALVDKLKLVDLNYLTIYLYQDEECDGANLSAGNWVALAGDFYGIPNEPICGSILPNYEEEDTPVKVKAREDAFKKAYATLGEVDKLPAKEKKDTIVELKKLKEHIAFVFQKINEGLDKDKTTTVKKILEDYSSQANKEYGLITHYYSRWSSILEYVPFSFLHSRYLDLARMNFDHFGKQAQQAYIAGHAVALQTALDAKKAAEDFAAKKCAENLYYLLLLKALTQELFACHFLTDLFASGHLRTPRYELLNYVNNHFTVDKLGIKVRAHKWLDENVKKGIVAGLLAERMHDEDGDIGLTITNDMNKNTKWQAKGDHCYHEKDVQDNKNRVHDAVMAALQSVYDTSLGKSPEYDFKKYLPRLIDEENHSPLFKVFPKSDSSAAGSPSPTQSSPDVRLRPYLKTELGKKCKDTDYISNWSPACLLLKFGAFKKYENAKASVYELSGDIKSFVESVSDELDELETVADDPRIDGISCKIL